MSNFRWRPLVGSLAVCLALAGCASEAPDEVVEPSDAPTQDQPPETDGGDDLTSPGDATVRNLPPPSGSEPDDQPGDGPGTEPGAEPAPQPPEPTHYPAELDGTHVVRVFYATDRAPLGEDVLAASGWARITTFYTWAVVAALAAAILAVAAVFAPRRWRWPAALVAVLMLAAAVWQWQAGAVNAQRRDRAASFGDRVYGSGRHEIDGKPVLEVGVCEVGIPPDHRVGRLESPSLLRFEVTEDPQKHVIIRRTLHQPDEEFYVDLRDVVRRSAEDEAFVFIHGYKVSFDNAVRRTAQMAYDLEFDGAPICYSWPSQGELASYTYDENNVAWTVVQLETFLERLRHESGARTIHLIAHSMGNRILVQALERMALRGQASQSPSQSPAGQPFRFGQIVLAAPDIDASAFRNRYAPLVAQMGRRVTMYASSNDQALKASLKIHGYDRAGLSGEHLVIVPGLDTVDASPIDTSLIGHSYYGDNPLMIRDLRTLIDENTPAEARAWLRQMLYRSDTHYWTFLQEPPAELLPPEP